MELKISQKRGSVLILVLWALGLLTVFAIQIGMTAQDKLTFLSRINKREILRLAARSGVYKGISALQSEYLENTQNNLLQRTLSLHYAPQLFQDFDVDSAKVRVSYENADTGGQGFGVTDEERRLNLNYASKQQIEKLFQVAGGLEEEEADKIAGAILDWRQYGETEIEGFYSDEYYDELEFPYKEKKALFETLDELLLVRGFSESLFKQMSGLVTVYGSGKINMNTASWIVLSSLGFSEEQAKTIVVIRSGPDGISGTLDDFIFPDANVLTSELVQALSIKDDALADLNRIVREANLTSESSYYRIDSTAQISTFAQIKAIRCVFDVNNDKIIYWREQ